MEVRSAPKEPNVRTYMQWSVSRLRLAERMADGGNLKYAAEFCDALFGDDRAAAVLQTRIQALLGSPLTFEASGDGRRKSRAVKALDAEEDWWTMAPTTELAIVVKWGLVLGVGPGSKKWIQRNGRDVPVLRSWHGMHVSYDTERRAWFMQTGDGPARVAAEDGVLTDPRFALFMPYGSNRPWSHAMWRGMSRWYMLKQYATDDWGRHSENASMKVAEYERSEHGEGSTKDARKELAEDLFEAARDAAIVMPDGFSLKLVEATANTRDIYEAQINAANLAYAIQALGHNLTTEVSSQGSFAAGKVGEGVRLDLKRFDNENVGTFGHDQLIVPWADANYADPNLAAWPWWNVEPRNPKAEADTMFQVANSLSIFVQARVPVDQRAVLEKYEIPMLPEGVEPPAPAAPAKPAEAA